MDNNNCLESCEGLFITGYERSELEASDLKLLKKIKHVFQRDQKISKEALNYYDEKSSTYDFRGITLKICKCFTVLILIFKPMNGNMI